MAHRYFTTPIYYVNDRPHIGHLYTTVVTDVLTRYRRLTGDAVRFLTGTDEHGQNIEKVARSEGIAPVAVADRNAPRFRELFRSFGIANDDFIRTTEARHRVGVEEIIRRIGAAGDLYLASHEGWYCPPCEAFYPEKDLAEGACPVHGSKLEWEKEENVFFRLSKYEKPLLALYDDRTRGAPFVFPESRLNEVRSFVAAGLKDLSVSRTTISWGIPFPGYPGHVVYVWLDALTNYVSALGFGGRDETLFRAFWPAAGSDAQAVHVVGKDILRFHAVYWPAFLMSAGLPVPTQVVGHGWWLKDARKMSKSVGNVVRPDELVASFGVDALRWHLVSEMTFGQDANFSDEAFLTAYNADLANGLGNTLSRAVRMAADAFGGRTPSERCDDNEVKRAAEGAAAAWREAFEGYRLQDAAGAIRSLLKTIDGYIAAKEPWKLAKADGVTPALHRIHHNCLEGLRVAASLLAPIAPETAGEVLRRLGCPKRASDVTPRDLAWGLLPLGVPLEPAPPLFPRADPKAFFASRGAGQPHSKKETTATMDNSTGSSKGKAPEGAPAPSGTSPAAVSPDSLSAQSPVVPTAMSSSAPTPPPATPQAARISIDEFARIEFRVGEVIAAEKVEKSKKLMKMSVRFGDELRTIVGGIATAYAAEQLVGKKFAFVYNLAPAKLMGIESNGMILAATMPETGEPSLLMVDPAVPSGAKVK
ncbi:MAG TPA: methionine--tRNA ligase [Thermoanaerobaculia bacterium]|nr:methionine--tRNA ligase [Thermoanaerobaculia bacterium]HQR68011.1 methionine--tRNA ligase [Thermoanaerobaculia bacterium]